MNIFPIPTHLKNILQLDENKSNKEEVAGKIVCSCGCKKFHIYHNINREYDHSIPYSEQDGLKVLIKCPECENSYILFDEATQGYNGFVCHDCKTANDENLEIFKCESCGANSFKIDVDIEAEDYEQFIEECVEEFPEDFSPEDYIDAFNWIVISLTCDKCNEKKELVNLELS